jgi:signal transduction histidine kinase
MAEGRSESELRDALASVGEETDRLARLADDLLVIARADAGKLPVRPETVSVERLAQRVAARFEARFPGRVSVRPGADFTVNADPARLEQALSNLVDNALRYGEGDVAIEASASGGITELHVIDNGSGFPPELIGRATERFTRADSARGNGGAGLGLAIVEAVARAHGGSVHVANRPGGGADVWLALP